MSGKWGPTMEQICSRSIVQRAPPSGAHAAHAPRSAASRAPASSPSPVRSPFAHQSAVAGEWTRENAAVHASPSRARSSGESSSSSTDQSAGSSSTTLQRRGSAASGAAGADGPVGAVEGPAASGAADTSAQRSQPPHGLRSSTPELSAGLVRRAFKRRGMLCTRRAAATVRPIARAAVRSATRGLSTSARATGVLCSRVARTVSTI